MARSRYLDKANDIGKLIKLASLMWARTGTDACLNCLEKGIIRGI